MASMATVRPGNCRLVPAKTPATCGTTEVTRKITMASATRLTMAGYSEADSSLARNTC
jgi:hypothetical protein